MGVFNRHKESDGRIWYTIKSKLQRIRRDRDHKFFEMPSIVIDLDAEHQRGVRSYEDDEDEAMGKKWFENPRRTAAYSDVAKLQRQVGESRQQWAKILAEPANPWRMNQHDLVSVALRGVDRRKGDRTPNHEELLFLRTLSKRNGIPKHAMASDTAMLEWMLLRKDAMETHLVEQHSRVLTIPGFKNAINNAGSLPELRRIISTGLTGSLGDERDGTTLFSGGTATLAICDKIVSLTKDSKSGSSELLEAMTILGNTSLYLLERMPESSAMLWQLGLQLASSHSLLTLIETARRGLQTGLVCINASGPGVFLSGMQTILSGTETVEGRTLWQLSKPPLRRLLFETLVSPASSSTSVAATRATNDTLRSLLVTSQLVDSGLSPKIHRALRSVYYALLGRLGARRALWAESRLLHDMLPEGALENEKESILFEIAEAAAQLPIFKSSPEPGLEERSDPDTCIQMDYRELVNQEMHGNVGNIKRFPDKQRLRAALDGSLEDWLKELACRA